ncbi:uroporphyrin-III C-methyltransferase [Skermanella stibiiresistens SB22]|uniref:uroporphyrinogen-III C-methyltransferase n=1 Tax=Skermanella stibiiresistens SB22 TaxID=1385369 RepID=W9H651_9PROT|nr:uroporphyrinogen-III C-methyltransferase [Skermanella stibiiresistens]EWY40271.1 uroporphyrin-III C-methyltransferase [Skermanella stibiiresistens SB22]
MIPSSSPLSQSLPAGLPFPEFEPGWVWLAGAGPGDPGLLTLHAWHALSHADVIVYDALVGPEILGLARPGSVLEFAGKRGGRPSPKQPDISKRLVELAQQGLRVLRLKGGDPFVFGRGGEEALTLVEHKVPFRVIPGITAGIGGLAYAGIPVTHRDRNHAVTFMTGHSASGLVPDTIDWAAVARGSPVIIMYMALKHLAIIADRFIEAGRPRDQAVAIVTNATLPNQHVLETTLERCAADVTANGIEPPAMVVVGDVVSLRPALDWLGALSGRQLTTDGISGTGAG